MVDETVDDAFGADHVVEDRAPIFEGSVGRDDRGATFIAGVDDVEGARLVFGPRTAGPVRR